MSSWYDPYPRTATDNSVALARRKRSPQRLILGPWTHGNNHETFAGDVDFGPAAQLSGNVAADLVTLRMRWFDRLLKGEKNAVAGGTVTSGQPVMIGGAFDQRESPAFFGSRAPYRPLASRADVLVFQTAPLASDVEVTGAIKPTCGLRRLSGH